MVIFGTNIFELALIPMSIPKLGLEWMPTGKSKKIDLIKYELKNK